jgi:hypothetical protein
MRHGHVTPNSDGSKARCGGPTMCQVYQREQRENQAIKRATSAIFVTALVAAVYISAEIYMHNRDLGGFVLGVLISTFALLIYIEAMKLIWRDF